MLHQGAVFGELEAKEKWVEKAEHLEVKQKKNKMKYLRPKLRPRAVIGKSEPHEDEPEKCPPARALGRFATA